MEKEQALSLLFSCLPLKAGDDAEMIRKGYMLALQECGRQALSDAVTAIIAGEADGLSRSFCPRPPQLGHVVREKHAALQRLVDKEASEAKVQAIIDTRPQPVRRPNVLERAEAERARLKAEGRQLLFKVASFDGYLQRRGEIPAGGYYSARLGEAYGPATVDLGDLM